MNPTNQPTNRRSFFSLLTAPLALLTLAFSTTLTSCMKSIPGVTPPSPPQPSTILNLIQGIVAAAESALATVGSYAGLSTAGVGVISKYLSSVGSAVSGVIAALQGGSVLSRVDTVVQALASLATSPILAGVVPVPIALLISGVAAAVDAFIRFLPATPPLAAARHLTAPTPAVSSSLKVLTGRAGMVIATANTLVAH